MASSNQSRELSRPRRIAASVSPSVRAQQDRQTQTNEQRFVVFVEISSDGGGTIAFENITETLALASALALALASALALALALALAPAVGTQQRERERERERETKRQKGGNFYRKGQPFSHWHVCE